MEFILLSTFVKFLKSRSRHLLKTEIDDTLQSVPPVLDNHRIQGFTNMIVSPIAELLSMVILSIRKYCKYDQ